MPNKVFFSFGGGVQSTAIALRLIHEPEAFESLELPELIIFADTGAETSQTYRHVSEIFKLLNGAGYSTTIVFKKHKNGSRATILDNPANNRVATAPFFTLAEDGSKGILRRQCTSEYKVQPVQKCIRSHLGYKKGQIIPPQSVDLWLGISIDEAHRMKDNSDRWLVNNYPLIDWNWDRSKCSDYCLKILGYAVPKSACFFCPFTHKNEWVRRKQLEPESFQLAVEFDEQIRNISQFGAIRQPCYIHPSCLPLADVVVNQMLLPLGKEYEFADECTGHCGV